MKAHCALWTALFLLIYNMWVSVSINSTAKKEM
jgi:hypothetical protein